MAIETAFRDLNQYLSQLHEVCRDLTIALGEDQPTERSAAAQRWADNAENLFGLVHEAKNAALSAGKLVGASTDLYSLRRQLVMCQQGFNSLIAAWINELTRFERIEEMVSLSQRPKLEFKQWTNSVRIALECCHRPIEECAAALLGCWQELAEQKNGVSVSVNALGMGRQLNATELSSVGE